MSPLQGWRHLFGFLFYNDAAPTALRLGFADFRCNSLSRSAVTARRYSGGLAGRLSWAESEAEPGEAGKWNLVGRNRRMNADGRRFAELAENISARITSRYHDGPVGRRSSGAVIKSASQ